jgi:hypothetical protein
LVLGGDSAHISERLTRCSDSANKWLERHQLLFLCVAGFLFVVTAIGHSSVKELWVDEVFSILIDRLPTPGAIWHALDGGLQQDPPVYHLLAHYLYKILPSTPLAARAPAIAGYLLMSISFYLLIRRHCPPVYAAAAFFTPGITFLRIWAWEARPYGLMLGASALCLLFWDGASSGKRPVANRVGVAVTIALALSLHFFGALLIAGLLAGEAAKWAIRRRPDLPTLAAMFAGALTLLVWSPLVRDDFALMRPLYRDRVLVSELFSIWNDTLKLAPVVLLIVLLVGIYVVAGEIPRRRENGGDFSPPERALLAVGAGFLLVPFAAFVQAHFSTGIFHSKYVMLTAFGPILLLPLLLAGLTSRSVVAGLCLLLATASNDAVVCARGISDLWRTPESSNEVVLGLQKLIPSANHDVVLGSAFDFLPLYYNSTAEFRNQLVYVFDAQKSLTYTNNGALDKDYENLVETYPADMESYDRFVHLHSHFYLLTVIGDPDRLSWLYIYQQRIQAQQRYVGQVGSFTVYEVSLPSGR